MAEKDGRSRLKWPSQGDPESPPTGTLAMKTSWEFDENFLKIDSKEFNSNSKNTDIEKEIRKTRKKMEIAAKELDFIVAAKFRDKIKKLKKILQSKT